MDALIGLSYLIRRRVWSWVPLRGGRSWPSGPAPLEGQWPEASAPKTRPRWGEGGGHGRRVWLVWGGLASAGAGERLRRRNDGAPLPKKLSPRYVPLVTSTWRHFIINQVCSLSHFSWNIMGYIHKPGSWNFALIKTIFFSFYRFLQVQLLSTPPTFHDGQNLIP